MRSLRIAVAMMQRNEGLLLRAWIDHYCLLTDPALISIADNGSSDQITLDALKYGESRGVNVVREHSNSWAFRQKGQIIRGMLETLVHDADFLLPCDCDEFLIAIDENSSAEEGVHAELARMWTVQSSIFRIGTYYYNYPGSAGDFYQSRSKKVIFRDSLPEEVDTGFHFFNWATNEDARPDIGATQLAFVHFHNKSLAQVIKASREKLKLRVPDFKTSTLRSYNDQGRHLRDYFFMGAEDYKGSFDKHARVALPIKGLVPSVYAAEAAVNSSDVPVKQADSEIFRLKASFNHAYHYSKIAMENEETDFYFDSLLRADKVFEYGMGGSTFLACNAGVTQVGTVEQDLDFISSTIEKLNLRGFIDGSLLQVFNRKLGETMAWGYPVNTPPSDLVAKFAAVERDFQDADLFLIDGRYRVSCAASVYLSTSTVGAKIFVHDFCERPEYKVLLTIFEPVISVKNLMLLSLRPNMYSTAREIFNAHLKDPR